MSTVTNKVNSTWDCGSFSNEHVWPLNLSHSINLILTELHPTYNINTCENPPTYRVNVCTKEANITPNINCIDLSQYMMACVSHGFSSYKCTWISATIPSNPIQGEGSVESEFGTLGQMSSIQ